VVRVPAAARMALVVVLVLALVLAAVWLVQRRLIYFPDRSAVPPAATVERSGK